MTNLSLCVTFGISRFRLIGWACDHVCRLAVGNVVHTRVHSFRVGQVHVEDFNAWTVYGDDELQKLRGDSIIS